MRSLDLRNVTVLVSGHPIGSHIGPMLPTAAGLRDAGARVHVACAPNLAGMVGDAGLIHVPVGEPWPDAEMTSRLARVAVWDNEAWMRELTTHAVSIAGPMRDRLLPIAEQLRPTVWIRDGTCLGSLLAAEQWGGLRISWDVGLEEVLGDDPTVWEQLSDVRGSAIVKNREAVITPMPPELLYPSLVGALTGVRDEWRQRPGDVLPSWVRDLRRDCPFVVVSLGSLLTCDALADVMLPILRRVIKALTAIRCEAVVLAGDLCGELQADATDHVRVARWMPLELAFSAGVDLAVTPCGYSTLREAFRHGVPILAMPLTTDQPNHARRLRTLGLATHVDPGASVDAIEAAIIEALATRHATAHRMVPWRRRMATLPRGVDAVARLIEEGAR